MSNFILFYGSGLFLGLGMIILKVAIPDLDSMFLIGMAGVIIVPLIKEAFNQLKTKKLLEKLKKQTGDLEEPKDSA